MSKQDNEAQMKMLKNQSKIWITVAFLGVGVGIFFLSQNKAPAPSELLNEHPEFKAAVSSRSEMINQTEDPARKLEMFRESQRFAVESEIKRKNGTWKKTVPTSRSEKFRDDLALATGRSAEELDRFLEIMAKAHSVRAGSATYSIEEFRVLEALVLSFDQVNAGRKLSEQYPSEFLSVLEAHETIRTLPGYASRIRPDELDEMIDLALQSHLEYSRSLRGQEIFTR